MSSLRFFFIVPFLLLPALVSGQNSINRYEYDSVGRLVRVVYGDSSSITYTYDRNGNILSIEGLGRNSAPTAASASIVTDEDTPSTPVTPQVVDPDAGDTHTFSIITQGQKGSAAVTANKLVYTPQQDFHGSDSFTFRATDAGALSVVGTASVTVLPVNDPPASTQAFLVTDEDTPSAPVTPTVVDVDSGDTHLFSIMTPAIHGTAEVIGNQLVYAPDKDYNGSDSFTFKATDQGNLSVEGTASILIRPVNDAPGSFTRELPVDQSVLANRLVSFGWTASTDVDGDTVVYLLRLQVESSDSTYIVTRTSSTVDFAIYGLSASRHEVRWTVTATDRIDSVQASNGEGRFILDSLTTDIGVLALSGFALEQNVPNPFSSTTQIGYRVGEVSTITIDVYSMLGRRIRRMVSDLHTPGVYRVAWDGRDGEGGVAADGVYFIRLTASTRQSVVLARTIVKMK